MSVLLYLPGILVILFKRTGVVATARHMLVLLLSQAAIGSQFLNSYPTSYLQHSYELTRVFLYKWTVNWRFVSEETFLSSTWARGLLLGHLATLIAFGAFKWCRRDGGAWPVVTLGLKSPFEAPYWLPITADREPSSQLSCSCSLISRLRCHHNSIHDQPHWDFVCSLASLPVLFMVRSTIAVSRMEN